jgi:CO/xanthine dehydrogenase Mo-binding subunit
MTTRREFLELVALAGGGFALGARLGADEAPAAARRFRPNAWVCIEPDGRIVVVVGHSEMGQGPRTALPMILADELDVGLEQITLEQASPNAEYDDLGTGGSSSVSDGWDPLRQAGAAARTMLVGAAAARWGIAPESCRTERGRVHESSSSRSLAYAELAADAARQPVPQHPRLKSRGERRLIGTSPLRPGVLDLVTGRARFGLDVRVPGQRFAVVARPPVLGGKLASFDPAPALARPGVVACFAIPQGIAVVATSTWAALRGRAALAPVWDDGPNATFSSAAHRERLIAASDSPGITTRRDGRGRDALAGAGLHEALYLYPYEAHAAVEPVNSTAHVRDDRCEIWSPTQTPNAVQNRAADALGIPRDRVTVHVERLGGGFGRRLGWDFDLEAVEVARRVDFPVQLVWSREDDLAHGYFQAACAHRLRARIEAGRVVAWEHCKLSSPHNARSPVSEADLRNPEYLAGESWGVTGNPYAIADLETSYTVMRAPVPIGPWRAVFSPSSVFARECFVDELAQALGRDPLALRLELLGASDPSISAQVKPGGDRCDRRRLRAVLELAAAKAGWSAPMPAGRSRGIACNVFHTETYVAYVVEVERTPAPLSELPFRVVRVVGAIDCGVVVHPDGVVQQAESGIIWSLSNLKTEMTFEKGRATRTNFDTFQVARIADVPEIEIHLVPSDDERPHGIGEPTVCPFAPAAVNALSRLLGRRLRELPVTAASLA